ncbi:restriction endonuclease subunit S [Shimia thalassica]|uniref:restriction endonuclease subunit S n=1 Tax=Shimia thalassica TaxID=1715693 RepID=UPI0026E43363|nr:restriction endonuclease subunit S [Shimia thalassica]MDO6799202.1 restriction endonuclease subunit S [Shimia thalassica]
MNYVSLGELTELVMGQAPAGKDCNKEGVGTPFVKAGEFSERYPVIREWTTAPKKHAKKGDVLVCVVGATSGKVNDSVDCAIGRSVAAVRPKKSKLDHGFLYRFLQSNELPLRRESQGLAQGVITKEMINRLTIPLPPLEEQKRIAGILDQADTLRRLRTRALDKLNTLGQAIFHEMFGDPVSNSKGLNVAPLSSVTTFRSGATPSKSNPDFWGGNVPWVTPKDMKVTWISGAQDHISGKALSAGNMKMVSAGTPLLVVRGMILAHTVPLALTKVDCTINQDMKAMEFDERINPIFGLFNLKCQHDSLLSRVSTAAHGTKRFDMAELGKAPMLLPDLTEQHAFVEALNQAESIVDKAKVDQQEQKALFASLQHRAFRGEL